MSETNGELIAEARDYPPCGCNGCWNELQRLADALEESEAQLAEALIEVRSRESWVEAWRAEYKWADAVTAAIIRAKWAEQNV